MANHGCPSLSDLNDGCCQDYRGVYLLRTTSQHCCEHLDEHGNVFSAYSNGEIKIGDSQHDNTSISSNGML